ncbi:hypothetical protein [Oecophyllibacter saccharovorans]|uniref:DUF3035 domain-containing protein n=1 Tax=Oecophyllibacter saccharovorans TaxID=2558360 RepID=A0A506URM0_9PROT|nr:hypothetical protein [Oecophyllibacter saccharovorans]TPW35995.1 hypothetical protein E3202_03555 [Oecophyllibacter saccharovorans]
MHARSVTKKPLLCLSGLGPALRPGFSLALVLSGLFAMSGCSSTGGKVVHRGLSKDGYGFIDNDPVEPPPPHLLQPLQPGKGLGAAAASLTDPAPAPLSQPDTPDTTAVTPASSSIASSTSHTSFKPRSQGARRGGKISSRSNPDAFPDQATLTASDGTKAGASDPAGDSQN